MQFTSFASMVVVVAAAAFVQAGPISGATDAAAADGAGSLLLTARDPKCQSHPESTEKQEKHIMQFVTFASMAAIMAAALVQASPLTTMDERSPNFKGSHCMIMASLVVLTLEGLSTQNSHTLTNLFSFLLVTSCCKSGEK
ncbi:hypothetical protein PG996_005924 [Apiospora saccharicola]|uniref:Uncharacterized protein n=1 Tax=Apiospora saccharicola TaxID=335842 RepID=A0ABR1VQJ4_9PEZI